MERLTYWDEEYGCWSYHGPSGVAAKRLAAYEDTGLEPEEIFSAVDMAKIACALHELNVYKELGSIDYLRKLAGGPGETSTITNGGKIRAMSNEELAEFISRIEIGDFGPQIYGKTFCDMCKGQYECDDCRLWWLRQPAEEDT